VRGLCLQHAVVAMIMEMRAPAAQLRCTRGGATDDMNRQRAAMSLGRVSCSMTACSVRTHIEVDARHLAQATCVMAAAAIKVAVV
jgi:hypothetical protein